MHLLIKLSNLTVACVGQTCSSVFFLPKLIYKLKTPTLFRTCTFKNPPFSFTFLIRGKFKKRSLPQKKYDHFELF